jgi:spore maturation protein CgeB
VPFNEQTDPRRDIIRRITEQTPCKTIAWFCDSHFRYGNFDSRWAPNLDYCVTTAQVAYPKYVADGFGQKVIKSQWFASPKYKKISVPLDVGCSFVGQPHGDRRTVIGLLRASGIQVQTFGAGWEKRLSFDEMVAMFNRSKINLNPNNSADATHKQIKGRNFEVPGCGGFLLTGEAENLGEYYDIDKEIITFSSTGDMIAKVKYYLAHEEQRKAIANAGYERTLREHMFNHRLDAIFARAGLL